ncbi:MAG: hypothetical protein LBD99_04135 [Candidatus Margulisbacteria bacterium]|nr:hypothetical protein [Candidatus Margulisiibacteriota bacterium]
MQKATEDDIETENTLLPLSNALSPIDVSITGDKWDVFIESSSNNLDPGSKIDVYYKYPGAASELFDGEINPASGRFSYEVEHPGAPIFYLSVKSPGKRPSGYTPVENTYHQNF